MADELKIRQLSLKIFAKKDALDDADLIPIFHKWIQEKRIQDKVLIDVADYRHVVDGPGVMLLTHEAHYGLDRAGGRLGLLYTKRRDLPGNAKTRMAEAFTDSLTACAMLEEEPKLASKLSFQTEALELKVQDRLLCPNTEETWSRLQPILQSFLEALSFDSKTLVFARDEDAKKPLTVQINAPGGPSIRVLLDRLSSLA